MSNSLFLVLQQIVGLVWYLTRTESTCCWPDLQRPETGHTLDPTCPHNIPQFLLPHTTFHHRISSSCLVRQLCPPPCSVQGRSSAGQDLAIIEHVQGSASLATAWRLQSRNLQLLPCCATKLQPGQKSHLTITVQRNSQPSLPHHRKY